VTSVNTPVFIVFFLFLEKSYLKCITYCSNLDSLLLFVRIKAKLYLFLEPRQRLGDEYGSLADFDEPEWLWYILEDLPMNMNEK
jgi:hypothetical protein